MIFVDVSHTSHCLVNTGIQRVCRSLARELAAVGSLIPIVFDPYFRGWRHLDRRERALLFGPFQDRATGKREASWSRWQRKRVRLDRLGLPTGVRRVTSADWASCRAFLAPELFAGRPADILRELFERIAAPKVAVFHDLVALKLPELTPAKTVARYADYLEQLRAFDVVAAVSQCSARDLQEHWDRRDLPQPPVRVVALGADPLPDRCDPAPLASGEIPEVLCVGSLEGRKNHLALLEACRSLWVAGARFHLRLIGMLNPETGSAAAGRVGELRAEGYPVCWEGPVSDDDLSAAYRRCTFVVYPSLYEGFGLPVIEALRYGRSVVCTSNGALGEVALGGGCLLLEGSDQAAIARGLERMLADGELRGHLEEQARRRPLRSWRCYARDLAALCIRGPSLADAGPLAATPSPEGAIRRLG